VTGELHRAGRVDGDEIAGDTSDEQIANATIEQVFHWDA